MKNPYKQLLDELNSENFYASFITGNDYANKEDNYIPELLVYGRNDSLPYVKVNNDSTFQMLSFGQFLFDTKSAFSGQSFTFTPAEHLDIQHWVFVYDELNDLQRQEFEDGLDVTYKKQGFITNTVHVKSLAEFFVKYQDDIVKYKVRPEELIIASSEDDAK